MQITKQEEKEVLQKRITVSVYNSKTKESTNEIYQYGLVNVLYDLITRVEDLENQLKTQNDHRRTN